MTTSIPDENWVLVFLGINVVILAMMGLVALVRVLDGQSGPKPRRPDREVNFLDEFGDR